MRSKLARVLLGVAALLALLIGIFWIRGSWGSTTEKNPTSSVEGAIVRLFVTPEGRKVVRCAVVIDRPRVTRKKALRS